VRYLTLAEALVIAEAVTGIGHLILANSAGVGLLDSALHAPQAGFGGHELYQELVDKAAVFGRPHRPQSSSARRQQTARLGMPHHLLSP